MNARIKNDIYVMAGILMIIAGFIWAYLR